VPQTLDLATLQAAGGPIAAGLLPGWTVTWVLCTQEQIDAVLPPGPNLAVCRVLEDTTPTRELATVYVLADWPESESLSETLHHEIGHAWASPLVKLIPDSAAAVLVEEQLVERLGKYLASLPAAARAAARRAIARTIETALPVAARARISARAGTRARGATMDPKLVQEALDALIEEGGGDSKCAQILKGLIASAASNGAPPPATEPDGDEAPVAAKTAEGPPPTGGAPAAGGPPPMDDSARKARKGAEQVETKDRAREREEDDAITAFRRGVAKDDLISHVRARLAGHDGLPAIERRILAAPTFQEAKIAADIALEMGGGVQRARAVGPDGKPVERRDAPAGGGASGACPFTAAQLEQEGLPPALAAEAVGQWSIPGVGPKMAQDTVDRARARLHGHASPFMPREKANGAAKGS